MNQIKISLFLFLISNLVIAFAGESLSTNTFKEIESKAFSLGKKYGNKNVLIVLDIDNTILTMPQELGSDQWFTWQYESCIKKKNLGSHCTTQNMGELLSLQGKLFSVSKMLPTEKITPVIVAKLQKLGFKIILLTSRGPTFRSATEKELSRNGYSMDPSAIGPKLGYAGTFKPYKLNNPKAFGISTSEAKIAKLGKPRSASYMNGVMMTSGMNKGIMLKTLLHKTATKFKGIIFADDHQKHTIRMQQILGDDKGVELVTFRYGAIDPQVTAFKKSNKKDVIKAFTIFDNALKAIFK
ncbi:MAG: DUF2608 domain-containing protein [Flavobacteriaceae bacterium]|nr:DUF2608 domain-containing protein [Flavobacteriaceae bacterium]